MNDKSYLCTNSEHLAIRMICQIHIITRGNRGSQASVD